MITIHNLRKTSEPKQPSISRIIQSNQGEMVGLVGNNGAGKTLCSVNAGPAES